MPALPPESWHALCRILLSSAKTEADFFAFLTMCLHRKPCDLGVVLKFSEQNMVPMELIKIKKDVVSGAGGAGSLLYYTPYANSFIVDSYCLT